VTVIARTLLEAKSAEIAQTTQYTAPSGTRTIIDKMTATNVTGVAATLSVNLVASAGAAAASNLVLPAQSIAAGTSYLCPEVVGHILNPADFISTIASAVSAITIRISGREVS
jgi:hypothetical protein